jgi:hypothetical protein
MKLTRYFTNWNSREKTWELSYETRTVAWNAESDERGHEDRKEAVERVTKLNTEYQKLATEPPYYPGGPLPCKGPPTPKKRLSNPLTYDYST